MYSGHNTPAVNYKMLRDPAVQKGKPLPEKGTCKHYKQSHRWLRCNSLSDFRGPKRSNWSVQNEPACVVFRFPCCGRAYPCDVCHDEDQDHPMELATRMICGYCAKEQVCCTVGHCIACIVLYFNLSGIGKIPSYFRVFLTIPDFLYIYTFKSKSKYISLSLLKANF